MRYIFLFIAFLVFSCESKQGGIEVNIFEAEGTLDIDTTDTFTPRMVRVELKNNSDSFCFLPGLGGGEFSFFDYLPIIASYGSPKEDHKARMDKLMLFLENGKSRNVSDDFSISLPVHFKRYQLDSKGNEIDLFYEIGELKEVYRTEELRSATGDYVPAPSAMLKSGLGDTLWLKPGEMEILTYDITPFLMRKGRFEFEFVLKPDSVTGYAFKNNIKYMTYIEGVKSYKLRMQSQ